MKLLNIIRFILIFDSFILLLVSLGSYWYREQSIDKYNGIIINSFFKYKQEKIEYLNISSGETSTLIHRFTNNGERNQILIFLLCLLFSVLAMFICFLSLIIQVILFFKLANNNYDNIINNNISINNNKLNNILFKIDKFILLPAVLFNFMSFVIFFSIVYAQNQDCGECKGISKFIDSEKWMFFQFYNGPWVGWFSISFSLILISTGQVFILVSHLIDKFNHKNKSK